MSAPDPSRLPITVAGPNGALADLVSELLHADGTEVRREQRPEAAGDTAAAMVVVVEEMGTVRTADVLRRLRRDAEDVRVVLVRAGCDGHAVRRALESGAHGVVDAEELAMALVPTVRAVAAGQVVVPATSRRAMAPPALSHRERQILALVAEGCTNGEVAQRLFLAESTVKSHLATAFAKLGVKSRRDATALILGGDPLLRAAVLGPAATARRNGRPSRMASVA